MDRFVRPDMFADLRQHGNTSWLYPLLLRTSLLWMVSERRTWRRRFDEVVRLWSDEAKQRLSFEGFLKAVRREYRIMLERLTQRLRRVMLEYPPEVRQVAGRDVFAVDGTSLELPRTRKNQKYFCGQDVDIDAVDGSEDAWKQAPQMHLTALWHVRLQLPWAWHAAPGDTNEKNDLRMLVKSLPEDSLVTADAGFVGYDLWETLLAEEVDLVIRVGSNVCLIEGLEPVAGRDDLVSFWPHAARREGRPPRLLRLVQTKLGETEAFVVTNVLDPDDLSTADVVSIYRARWGVEVFYRDLKQTWGRRRLIGRTPETALAELELSLHSLWLIHLMGLYASGTHETGAHKSPPLSTVKLLDAVRDAISRPDERPSPGESLLERMRTALIDSYIRRGPKNSRRYPRKVTQKKCGSPTIRPPIREEQTKFQSLIRNGLYTPARI